ncbi:MAG: hypothetical protein GY852_00935 [bacterium]|nr:hypothetical protein [bacterium]
MIKVQNRLAGELPGSGLILQVHDELVLSCPQEAQSFAKTILKEEMQQAFQLEVPLIVETGSGSNWLDAGH